MARGQCVVEVLSRRRFFLDQRLEAFDVLPGLQEYGFGLRDISHGLSERAARTLHFRFVRPLVEDVEDLAGAHVGSDVERAAVDVAVHAAADLDEIACIGPRRVFTIRRHVFARDMDDADLGRRRGSGLRRRLPAAGGQDTDR